MITKEIGAGTAPYNGAILDELSKHHQHQSITKAPFSISFIRILLHIMYYVFTIQSIQNFLNANNMTAYISVHRIYNLKVILGQKRKR